MTLEEALVKVWRAALVENAPEVELTGQTFPVRTTQKQRLRQVDFVFDGQEVRGLEQNPETGSRWAQLARSGHRVMQFLSAAATWRTSWMAKRPCMARRQTLHLA